MKRSLRDHVVLLVGGVGGAKLAVGMAECLPPNALTIIVNTADDFEHLGLHVSPDLDTVIYSLSGLAHPINGWGIADDTSRAMDIVSRLGGPDWFRLGDSDIGTNLMRTSMLHDGKTLTQITTHFSHQLGIKHHLLPMTNDQVSTVLETDQGTLGFQEYFVRERWQPVVQSIHFEGILTAHASHEVESALDEAALIIFGPSNPYLSIDPILAVPGIRQRIEHSTVPCIAVSPIIGGRAIKGPAAKLMAELGVEVSPRGIAEHFAGLLDGLILDAVDYEQIAIIEALGIRAMARQTLMESLSDKVALAENILHWTEETYL